MGRIFLFYKERYIMQKDLSVAILGRNQPETDFRCILRNSKNFVNLYLY